MKTVKGRLTVKGALQTGKTTQAQWFASDWKDTPHDAMVQVNAVLKAMNIDVEFIEVDTGSDSYVFAAVKGA